MPLASQNDGIRLFGSTVRKIRKSRKLSMQALANIAEIELSQVARIETGQINPKLSTILILAKALEIGADEFFKTPVPDNPPS